MTHVVSWLTREMALQVQVDFFILEKKFDSRFSMCDSCSALTGIFHAFKAMSFCATFCT